MRSKLVKWGNSLGLRLPKVFADDLGLRAGSELEINLEEGRVVIEPVVRPPLVLEDLLAGINRENLHQETDMGDAVGGEIW